MADSRDWLTPARFSVITRWKISRMLHVWLHNLIIIPMKWSDSFLLGSGWRKQTETGDVLIKPSFPEPISQVWKHGDIQSETHLWAESDASPVVLSHSTALSIISLYWATADVAKEWWWQNRILHHISVWKWLKTHGDYFGAGEENMSAPRKSWADSEAGTMVPWGGNPFATGALALRVLAGVKCHHSRYSCTLDYETGNACHPRRRLPSDEMSHSVGEWRKKVQIQRVNLTIFHPSAQ